MTEQEDRDAQARLERLIRRQGRQVPPRSSWHFDARSGMYFQTLQPTVLAIDTSPEANLRAAFAYMRDRYDRPSDAWKVFAADGSRYTQRPRRWDTLRFAVMFVREHGRDVLARLHGRRRWS